MGVIFANKRDQKENIKDKDPNFSIGPKFKGSEGSINGMGINLTNTQIYTGASDGTLIIWS